MANSRNDNWFRETDLAVGAARSGRVLDCGHCEPRPPGPAPVCTINNDSSLGYLAFGFVPAEGELEGIPGVGVSVDFPGVENFGTVTGNPAPSFVLGTGSLDDGPTVAVGFFAAPGWAPIFPQCDVPNPSVLLTITQDGSPFVEFPLYYANGNYGTEGFPVASGFVPGLTYCATITALECPPDLPVLSGTPPVAEVGSPYAFVPAITGGVSPFAFAGSTTAPGLTVDPALAVIGTPTTAGTWSLTITATDDDGLTSAPYTVPLVVDPLP